MLAKEIPGQQDLVQKLAADAIPKGGGRNGRTGRAGRCAFPGMEAKTVEDILERRSSVRFFSREDGIRQDHLKRLLSDAALFAQSVWGNEEPLFRLRTCVFPERIAGGEMDPARAYEFLPGSGAFVEVGRMPPDDAKERLVLQREFADAAAIVIWTAGLADAVRRHGSYAYKELLIRSGAAAHFAWLRSLALGYEGTVFAGILPKALRQICGVDGYRSHQTFALALGKGAPSTADESVEGR